VLVVSSYVCVHALGEMVVLCIPLFVKKIGLNLSSLKICQKGRLLGICIGCIIAKTNIHVCVVGYYVPT